MIRRVPTMRQTLEVAEVGAAQAARRSSGVSWTALHRRLVTGETVSGNWQQAIIDRLVETQGGDGGWGYRRRGVTCAEPTALACMALSRIPNARPGVERGLQWLATLQRNDGGVPITENITAPCWPTGLAVLAWLHSPTAGASTHTSHIEGAISWLCRTAGLPIPRRPEILGHDTTLIGWSWVEGTHSWVEPTAYAVWALRQAGLAKHKRTREGIDVLLDRVTDGGGWNYGNPEVLRRALLPFPATTGQALRALAGEPSNEGIERSVAYLRESLKTVRAPMSLGWGVLGLAAWHAHPAEVSDWLAECAVGVEANEPSAVYDALLLLADDAVAAEPIAHGGAEHG